MSDFFPCTVQYPQMLCQQNPIRGQAICCPLSSYPSATSNLNWSERWTEFCRFDGLTFCHLHIPIAYETAKEITWSNAPQNISIDPNLCRILHNALGSSSMWEGHVAICHHVGDDNESEGEIKFWIPRAPCIHHLYETEAQWQPEHWYAKGQWRSHKAKECKPCIVKYWFRHLHHRLGTIPP